MTQSNTNDNQKLLKILDMLLRYHRHLGLSHEQYLLLHTCIQYDEMTAIKEITGFSEGKIIKMLKELMEKELIIYQVQKGIEIDPLYDKLMEAELTAVPFRELLIRDYQQDRSHIGHMEFVPMKEGIAVRMRSGKYLPVEKVRELMEELNRYLQTARQEGAQQQQQQQQQQPPQQTSQQQQNNRRLYADQLRKDRHQLGNAGLNGSGRIKKVTRP
jgi:hypothetical protein